MGGLRLDSRLQGLRRATDQEVGGAQVDTNALVMQLNFDAAPSAGVTIRWQSTDVILQAADKVNGPYSDVPGAVSPLPAAQRGAVKFYRYRGHVPQVLVSNPYLM